MADDQTPAANPIQSGTLIAEAPPAAPPADATLLGDGQTKPVEQTPTPEPAKPIIPEKYELKLPENSAFKPDYLEQVQAFAKERGLSNEQAQSVLDRDHASFNTYRAEETQRQTLQNQAWISAVKSDQEIGGQYFDQTVELASKVVNRYGTPELKAILNKSGLGNNPELIRAFSRIAKTMSNDQLVMPGTQAERPMNAADILYPKK